MKRILFTLAQLCLLVTVSANIVQAQNHTQTVSVTNVAANITADGNYNQILLRENSATPTAAFSITLAGSSTAINYPAGTQFLFSGNFMNGQVIGTIQATTAGPFTFIAVEASGPPSMSVKNTIIGGGGSGNATSIQGLSVSSSAPTGGVNCFETNTGDTQALWVACGSGGTVTTFSAGNLLPLFTSSVATATTTPALTFTLSTAAANTVFGNCTVTNPAAPSYCSITGAMLPNPGPSTLGGVESLSVVVHNFLTGISTSGVPTQAQPAFSDISGTLAIAQGGTGTTSAANALINLLPVASEVGDLIYCSSFSSGCTAWSILPGNTSGTKVLQETSSGVPSWVANGGVSSFTGDGVIITNSASTGAVTTSISGTSGGIVYFSSSSAWASSVLLTLNRPILGGGSGGAPTVGTVSGNTTEFVTATGTLTSGDFASWDANGNAKDSGIAANYYHCGKTSTSDQLAQTTSNGIGTFATTCSLPGTGLAVGSTIVVNVKGVYTSSATSSPKLGFTVTAGSTTNICENSATNMGVTSGQTNAAWQMECVITIVSTGSGGTAQVGGQQQAWSQGTLITNGLSAALSTQTFNTSTTETVSIGQIATMVSGQTATLTVLNVDVRY
jgi:hypothetical protein